MGGDLNLKKSWHPVLMSNQKRVWEEEKKALEERKRIDQMMKERQEERHMQELEELQEAAGGKKRLNRVDWMYSGPSTGEKGTTEEMEGYLLGKRRIDGLLKGTENQKLEKQSTEDSFMAVQNANTMRDTATKVREDPMLAIKKQEQAAYEAMMNDPVKRRMLLKAAGADSVKDAEPERKRRKHHHHHHHHHHHRRHGYDDRRRSSHRSHRYEDEKDDRRERSQFQSKRRDYSSTDSRSASPPPRRSRRSPSPYMRRRSYSPGTRNRSRSPYVKRETDQGIRRMQSWQSSRPAKPRSRTPPIQVPPQGNDERAAKLAAMQQAATELDGNREKRLAALAEKDKFEAEKDDKARMESAKYGGRADFVNGLNRKAGSMDLGDRIGRQRGGMERQQEAY